MNSRAIKILLSAAVGLYISLVCFNNIFDADSNFPFINMVAKMEDTFSKQRNGWRSVNSLFLQHMLFIIIIAWELLMAFFLWFGVFKMTGKMRATAAEFRLAKKYTSIGLALGILLWFVVFITIGGEWFLMWQSKNWNAQATAFSFDRLFFAFFNSP